MVKPCIFLDRDGVITKEKSYVRSVNELEIFDYSRECIEKIHEKGYLAIVITNQSGVARGYFTEDDLKAMNEHLKKELSLDAVFYCPHYENGIIPRYSVPCACRKPQVGMLQKACKSYKIDMLGSWMIGDRDSDILTGKNAGLRTILLESGYGSASLGPDIKPDHIFNDLRDIFAVI